MRFFVFSFAMLCALLERKTDVRLTLEGQVSGDLFEIPRVLSVPDSGYCKMTQTFSLPSPSGLPTLPSVLMWSPSVATPDGNKDRTTHRELTQLSNSKKRYTGNR